MLRFTDFDQLIPHLQSLFGYNSDEDFCVEEWVTTFNCG